MRAKTRQRLYPTPEDVRASMGVGVGGGGQEQNTGYFLFQLEIELTLEGLNAAPGLGLAAAELLFAYITMLKKAGPQKWIWDEMKGLNDCNFRCAHIEPTCC